MGEIEAGASMPPPLRLSSDSDINDLASVTTPLSSMSENPKPSTQKKSSSNLLLFPLNRDILNLDSPKTPESARAYVAPRAVVSRQDSSKEDSRFPESPMEGSRREGKRELVIPRLRVSDSPRALRSPRVFRSSKCFGSPMSAITRKSAGMIDTAAPFESVKEAVSIFGEISEWKAQKMQNIEKRKQVEQELERIQDNIADYRKQSEASEKEKQQILKELERTTRLVEDLKLRVKKAKIVEHQAKQDSELAKLRAEEIEQGIADEESFTAKEQLEVAKERYETAVSELRIVKEELELINKELNVWVEEKDSALRKAEEAAMEFKEAERKMEEMTVEVIATQELLESAQTEQLEAEENRFRTEMAFNQDICRWEKELKIIEDEIEILNQKIHSENEVRIKLEASSSLLMDLKSELAAYKEDSELGEGNKQCDIKTGKKSHKDTQIAIASAKKELEEVKLNVEKANSEVDALKMIAESLQSKLEREKSDLAETKQREGTSMVKDSSLEPEMKTEETPKRVEEAMKEEEEVRLIEETAREELRIAKQETENRKAELNTLESKLAAALKEMKAARASERLALSAIKTLQDSEMAQKSNGMRSPRTVMLTLQEYYELSKCADKAEEQANCKVAAAASQIEEAKEKESRILDKLEEVNREMAMRKEELAIATEKEKKATEGKLGLEQELRRWREEQEQRGNKMTVTDGSDQSTNHESNPPNEMKRKKKLSLVPKIFMLLSRKKLQK